MRSLNRRMENLSLYIKHSARRIVYIYNNRFSIRAQQKHSARRMFIYNKRFSIWAQKKHSARRMFIFYKIHSILRFNDPIPPKNRAQNGNLYRQKCKHNAPQAKIFLDTNFILSKCDQFPSLIPYWTTKFLLRSAHIHFLCLKTLRHSALWSSPQSAPFCASPTPPPLRAEF